MVLNALAIDAGSPVSQASGVFIVYRLEMRVLARVDEGRDARIELSKERAL